MAWAGASYELLRSPGNPDQSNDTHDEENASRRHLLMHDVEMYQLYSYRGLVRRAVIGETPAPTPSFPITVRNVLRRPPHKVPLSWPLVGWRA